MKVEDLIIYGKKYVSSAHAKMLLADILGVNSLELLTMLENEVKEDAIHLYKKELEALKDNKPIQYVIGHVNFYGQEFLINPHVLIPRFETEELVENVISYIRGLSDCNIKILDLGCGSGVIGLTLKRVFPTSKVTLTDISEEALFVALENARRQKLDVMVIQSDWFSNIPLEEYDIIVSNPPYIKEEEQVDPIVKENEPHLALYGGRDGLTCYRKIFSNIKPYLKKSYFLAFEIGCDQKETLMDLAQDTLEGSTVFVKKDMQGRNRMLFVYQKCD